MAEISVKNWIIRDRVDAVLDFVNHLNITNIDVAQHPCFPNQFQFVAVSAEEMMSFHTPYNMTLLATNVNKDGDPENEKIQHMAHIRDKLACYIRHFYNSGPTHTTKEFLDFVKILYLFRVFFNKEQYGFENLRKMLIRKLLEFMSLYGILALFLIFCEFCPNMVCNDFFPVCKASNVDYQLLLVEQDPLYSALRRKHENKWNLFLMPQNTSKNSS